jgi:hypothetical protein
VTVGEALARASERLRAAGSETPRLDAELLLGWSIGIGRTGILAHPDAPVGADAEAAFEAAVARREAGEPVAYIRGIKEFHGLAFGVDARALIPRPETEALVDEGIAEVMRRLAERTGEAGAGPGRGGDPIRVADVGTGSGAIAVALAVALRARRVTMGRNVWILATDVSSDALDLARENAVGHAAVAATATVPATTPRPKPTASRANARSRRLKASSCTVKVVPMSAPRITPRDWRKVMRPADTNPISMRVVAEDDWINAVTSAPAATAEKRLRVMLVRRWRSWPPAARCRPSPDSCIP